MAEPTVIVSPDGVAPGEAYLDDTPVLRAHAGTQPDLYLCWNAIPPDAAALDIVVHLHGFSREGAKMPLSEKVARAGLDLGDRSRPTLALIPRGNWLEYSRYDLRPRSSRVFSTAIQRWKASTQTKRWPSRRRSFRW